MVKFVQYGCGKMSKYTMRYALDIGMELVGAVDINPALIGTEVNGVTIVHPDEFDKLLKDTKPDVVFVTTRSLLSEVADALLTCANNGVNAITTCEEAFYPHISNPVLTARIDAAAKAHHCTITGTGYQDAYWGNLIASIAGSSHNIKKIKGSSSYNVEDYGIALAEAHGAGMTLEEFDQKVAAADKISPEERRELITRGEFLPSYMWNVVGWLTEKLAIGLDTVTQQCIPTTHNEDLHSETLGMDIKAGDATGMSAVVTATTPIGIEIEAECIGKVYAPGEVDKNEWTIEGDASTTLVITQPDTVRLTCATVVNRVPDVINGPEGFVPTCRLGDLKYIHNAE